MTQIHKIVEALNNSAIKARVERTITTVKEGGWHHEFQGSAVNEELKNLLTQVSLEMPNVKFHPFDDQVVQRKTITDENGTMHTKVAYVASDWFVYTDDFPYEIGRISYRDHSAKRDGKELTYAIFSRKVRNAKYHTGRDQHHMVMTKDIGKAVKLAKTYLTPYSTYELALASYDEIRDGACKALNNTNRDMRSAIEPIRNNADVLIAEMLYLIKQGARFSTEGFKSVATKLEEKVMAYKAEEERNVGALFVRLYNVGEDTYADVQEAHNIRKNQYAVKALNSKPCINYKMSDLPEDVVHVVASLSILERGQYVTGVGMKIDERHFWVERG